MTQTAYTDDARAVATLRKALDGKALKPPKETGKHLISARLSEKAHDGLKQLAERLGYTHSGHGNVSLLLEAIGTGTLEVSQPPLQVRHRD